VIALLIYRINSNDVYVYSTFIMQLSPVNNLGPYSNAFSIVFQHYSVNVFSHHHEGRTKKRLSDIRKRLDSLETLVQQQIQQQNENMKRIYELLQQQHRTVVVDRPTERTVTFDAEATESHA